jgi:hypothetical protein
MKVRLAYFGAAVLLIGLFSLFIVPSGPPLAQHEVTSKIYRYRERVATGYYEGYEVSPRRKRAVLAAPGVRLPGSSSTIATPASSAIRKRPVTSTRCGPGLPAASVTARSRLRPSTTTIRQ